MDLADVDASFVRGAHAIISASEYFTVFLQVRLGFVCSMGLRPQRRSSLGAPCHCRR